MLMVNAHLLIFVVVPSNILIKYVYGISPIGVKSPVSPHISAININHFPLEFFQILFYL